MTCTSISRRYCQYEHQSHLDKVLKRFEILELTCHTKKCKIGSSEISFLVNIIDSDRIQKQLEILECINNILMFKKVKDIHRFLRICNWYNQIVDNLYNYTNTIALLTNVLKHNAKCKWVIIEQRAFNSIKNALFNSLKLFTPYYTKLFFLEDDASKIRVGSSCFLLLKRQ